MAIQNIEIPIMEIPIIETQIIKTNDPNIVQEVTTIVKEIDLSFLKEELNGCMILLEEQEQIQNRLKTKMTKIDDEEIIILIKEKIDKVEENKRGNLIRISELSENLK